jgi:hypothetical protein
VAASAPPSSAFEWFRHTLALGRECRLLEKLWNDEFAAVGVVETSTYFRFLVPSSDGPATITPTGALLPVTAFVDLEFRLPDMSSEAEVRAVNEDKP